MASPFTLFIAPSTGIELEILHHGEDSIVSHGNKSRNKTTTSTAPSRRNPRTSIDPHDIMQGSFYKLTDLSQFHLKDGADYSEISLGQGFMSPISNITLPPIRREKAGIHPKATKYAFLHPPKALANEIQWSHYDSVLDEVERSTIYANDHFQDNPNKEGADSTTVNALTKSTIDPNQAKFAWAIPFFAVSGAYVYMDDDLHVLAVNVVVLQQTQFKLNLSGPFKTPDTVVRAMQDSKRLHVMPLDAFHANSFVALGWVRPNETFETIGPSQSSSNMNRHGSFVILRCDGTALTYSINGILVTEYSGESSIIPEIFASKACRACSYADMTFATNFITTKTAKDWRTYITMICKDKKSGSERRISKRAPHELEDEKSLIHEACRASVALHHLKMLLQESSEVKSLTIQDRFGWNPLHYACAFSADNDELIKFLIEKSPQSVSQKDPYGRYPLHIACDYEDASLAVIQLLLAHDRSIVLERTKYLERIPLHIALSRGLAIEIIQALLETDEDGQSIRFQTEQGCRAIHYALQKKVSADIIQLLLEADTRLWIDPIDLQADIYTHCRGFIPLHIACATAAPRETIALLLDKDINGRSLTMPVEGSLASKLPSPSLSQSFGRGSVKGKIALHIAIAHSSEETVRLLLKRSELEGEADDSIFRTCESNRTALHMACKNNVSPDIIALLLKIDRGKNTTVLVDNEGMSPIHYACDHSNARTKSIGLLIDAEEKYNRMNNDLHHTIKQPSTHTPFWYACRSGAPPSAIGLLMSQPDFSFKGFDRRSMKHDFADLVKKHPPLQRLLNRKLSSRINIVRLIFKLFINFVVLLVFYICIEDLSEGQGSIEYGKTLIMWVCIGFLLLIEALQIMNQSLRSYLTDLWNWYEMIMIGLLTFSTLIIHSNRDVCVMEVTPCILPQSYFSVIITTTGILLVTNVIFSLRTTFLPFALFATGIMNILKTLVPFFSTSLLILVAFAEKYRVDVFFVDNTWAEDSFHSQCTESFQACILAVVQGFFGGPEKTAGVTDIFYGILVAIVLLNVVIAIVSDSWEESKAVASTAFWQSRVNLLSESGYISIPPSRGASVFSWIDSLKWTPLNDQISWTKDEPYKFVLSQEEYENPLRHFTEETAELIDQARSLDSTLYWIKQQHPTDGFVMLQLRLIRPCTSWCLQNATFLIFVILGTLTLGLLWPVDLSHTIISTGHRVATYHDKPDDTDHES